MAKPTLQFKNLSELQVLQYAESILVKMTENVLLFPEPSPTLASLETAIGSFRTARTEAVYRDMRLVEIKNERLAELKTVMLEMSLYVSRISKGNRSVILAAGFTTNRDAMPLGEAPKPTDLRAIPNVGVPGQVLLRVRVWPQATMYFFEYRKLQSTDPWVRLSTTRSTAVINGLDSLQIYEFRVAYASTNPQLTYSDVIRSSTL